MMKGNDPTRKPIHVTDFKVTYSLMMIHYMIYRVPLGIDTASFSTIRQ